MIVSMTGFARCETTAPGGTLVCELRSVNHRFLEAALRLPEELRSLVDKLVPLLGELSASSRAAGSATVQVNVMDLLRYPGVLREGAGDAEALSAAARTLFAR